MPRSLINETPQPRWAAGQAQKLNLTCTLAQGLTLADYGTLTLTVREDPLWPRSGRDEADAATADPVADGWPVALTAVGTATGDTVAAFALTVPTGAGAKRYALDVVASGGSAGRVQLVDPTWLTVTPSLKS